MSKENKYGLSRHIKKAVKHQIRREAYFGCIICGNLLIEYEHIEPEFKNARWHNPQKMTILCSYCHSKVTRGIISKKEVWEYKKTHIYQIILN